MSVLGWSTNAISGQIKKVVVHIVRTPEAGNLTYLIENVHDVSLAMKPDLEGFSYKEQGSENIMTIESRSAPSERDSTLYMHNRISDQTLLDSITLSDLVPVVKPHLLRVLAERYVKSYDVRKSTLISEFGVETLISALEADGYTISKDDDIER